MIVVPESKVANILLIEDDAGDIEIIKEKFESNAIPTKVCVAHDGCEALKYLRRKEGYENAKRPDLILLDLNLPKKDGRELLDTIKQDPILKIIPVIIITGSDEDRDIIMSYMLHANAYVVKPIEHEKFMTTLEDIQKFWLGTAILP